MGVQKRAITMIDPHVNAGTRQGRAGSITSRWAFYPFKTPAPRAITFS